MKLQIEKLNVEVDNKKILKDFDLNIGFGEIHAIMGPNGVGKSTLSRAIMGDNNYKVTNGDIKFNDESILGLRVDERSKLGIFLAMQYPMEIDGVSNQDFLRTAISVREGKKTNLYQFIKDVEKATDELSMNKELIHRSLNIGFSGGEKKKNEVLQIKLLKPSLIIMDELDSGLDIDSLRIVGENINKYREEYPDTSIIIITHYAMILDMLKPDYVHVLNNGHIVHTGDYSIVKDILDNGFNKYIGTNEEENNE